MTWLEKIQSLEELVELEETLQMYFDLAEPASREDLDQLQTLFEAVPEQYLNFLRKYNGIQIDLFVLFGVGVGRFPSLVKSYENWKKILPFDTFIPIGEDWSGDLFILHRDGSVGQVEVVPPYVVSRIAQNFDTLLDQVFLGPGYEDQYLDQRGNSDWWDLIADQGWT